MLDRKMVTRHLTDASGEYIKLIFELSTKNHCGNPAHRVEPRDAGDWDAVLNWHRRLVSKFIELSESLLKVSEQTILRIASDDEDTRSTIEQVADAKNTLELSAAYAAVRLSIQAHDSLCEHGAMGTRNADIHYERVKGIAQEMLMRSTSDRKAGNPDRSHSRTRCEDQGHGTADKEAEEASGKT